MRTILALVLVLFLAAGNGLAQCGSCGSASSIDMTLARRPPLLGPLVPVNIRAQSAAIDGWNPAPRYQTPCAGGSCAMPGSSGNTSAPPSYAPASPHLTPGDSPGANSCECDHSQTDAQLGELAGKYDALAGDVGAIKTQLASIEPQVGRMAGVADRLEALLADPEALRGPAGPKGEPGDPGADGMAGEPGQSPTQIPPTTPEQPAAHIVVVADRASRDWPRLEGFVTQAQAHYHALRVAGLPPFDIGEIPQLVVYRGGVPHKVIKGRQAVEAALSSISRGQPPS